CRHDHPEQRRCVMTTPARLTLKVTPPANRRSHQWEIRAYGDDDTLVWTHRADLMSKDDCDETFKSLAKYLQVRGVARKELRQQFKQACLDGIQKRDAVQAAAEEKPGTPDGKVSTATRIVQLVHEAGVTLFHDDGQVTYATFTVGEGDEAHQETWPLHTKGFR